MNRSSLLGLLTAGICFGLWPLVMKKSGLHPMTQAVYISLLSVALIGLVYSVRFETYGFRFSWMALASATLNAIGVIVFLKATESLNSVDPRLIGKGILTLVLVQVVVNEVGSVLMYGSPMTIKKLAGFASAIVTFILLVG